MKFRSILALTTALLLACGSEQATSSAKNDPPGLTDNNPPPGVTNDVDPVDTTPGADAGEQTDPGLDAGSDVSDGGSTDDGGSSDGGTTDPNNDGGVGDTDGGTGPVDVDAGSGDDDDDTTGDDDDDVQGPPTSVTVGGVKIELVSNEGNTFCYQVTELDNCKDLSHWDLATNCVVLSGSPTEGFVPGTDPKSGLTGVKWNVSSDFETGLFCVTVDGSPTIGEVDVASKSGWPFSFGKIAGPVCQ